MRERGTGAEARVVRSGFTGSTLLSLVVAALFVAQPVSAALTSAIEDPVGDVGSPAGTQPVAIFAVPYQDIIGAAVTLKDGQFTLTMRLAASIPESPALPPNVVLLEWGWWFGTDPTTAPAGFPYSPGLSASSEFALFVLWDGTSFTATLIDRRPLLTGGEALLTSIPFGIKGSVITASVNAALLDNPSSFLWFADTEIWETQLGTASFHTLDVAPDLVFAVWPA